MTGGRRPADPVDERIGAMLERRALRDAGLGTTLGERARAVARRDGALGDDVVPAAVHSERVHGGAPRPARTMIASVVATIAIAAGLLVAVGFRPQAGPPAAPPSESASSPLMPASPWEAITWRLAGSREIVFDADSSSFVVDAAPWGEGLVGIGYDIDGATITGRVWRSTDGLDWREITGGGPPFDRISLDRVFALDDRLVITGRDRTRELGGAPDDPGTPVAFESADGESWAAVRDANSPWLRPGLHAAASGGGSILALEEGDDSRLWRSGDGRTWTSTPLGEVFPQAVAGSIAWTGGRWLVGGVTGERPPGWVGRQSWGTGAVWVSPDGVRWTSASIDAPKASMGPFAVGRAGIVAIAGRTGGGAIILSESLWRSVDGSTWAPLAFDNFQLRLLSDGVRIVALDVPLDGRLRARESFDGATWRELDVLGLGAFDPADPATLDGMYFPGNFQPVALTPNGVWGLGREFRSRIEGVSDTESELRWFGAAGRLPGAAPFPPRPLPGLNDTPCLPAGQECG